MKKKSNKLTSEIELLSADDPRRMQIITEREVLEAKRIEINDKVNQIQESLNPSSEKNREEYEIRERNPDLYFRPNSMMSKKIGPLPSGAKILKPSLQDMREVESHNLLLTLTCAGLLVGVFALYSAAPWLGRGISGLWSQPSSTSDQTEFGWVHVFALAYVGLITIFRDRVDNVLFQMMIEKEQRWRMGSERWTWPQRGNSYLAAMLSTVFYALVFPLVVICFFWLPIPILSKLYLDTYSRTGDVEYATLTSAKFNARLWKYLMLCLLVAASLPWLVDVVS